MSQGSSRREFVLSVAASAAAFIPVVACAISVRGEYLGPTSAPVPGAGGSVKASPFDAGPVDALKEGISDEFVPAQKFLLVKKDGKIIALSAICLHEKGTLKNGGDGQIWCTKHAPGRFDDTGKPLAGPPTKRHGNEHLTRYGISIKDGHLFIDKSKTFTKDADFEKTGAFVKVG